MQIRCPQCQRGIECDFELSFVRLECSSCGGRFSLLAEDTVSHHKPSALLGRFQLIDRIGVGGFGTVWMARDTQLDRLVALKMPRAAQLDTAELDGFLREARAAAQLSHPNIVSVHEVGRVDDTVYIVSDFVRGVTLSERMAAIPYAPREAAELCLKLAQALHHAHELGVIHRDVKPGNVLIDTDGEPHLTDFGLAKRETGEVTVTIDGAVIGTPAYMSPEVARGEAHYADRRCDIYSLGVVLYRMLTGELPFRGNPRMMMMQILRDDPVRLRHLNGNIARDLETICLKCLEKDRNKRYSTCQELAGDLSRYLRGEPISARPIGVVQRAWRWCRRNQLVAGLAGLVVAALSIGTLASTYFAVQAHRNARQMRSALYHGILREIEATRTARKEGYRTVVWDLASAAHELDPPDLDRKAIRRAAVASMGDFVGFAPVTFDGFDGDASAAALAPDGSTAAIGCAGGSILLCDVVGAKLGSRLIREASPVVRLAFTPNGRTLLAGHRSGRVFLWQSDSAGVWTCSDGPDFGNEVRAYDFSTDGRTVVVATPAGIAWTGISAPAQLDQIEYRDEHVGSVVMSADRALAAATAYDPASGIARLVVWDVSKRTILRTLQFRHGNTYRNGLALSADGKLLALGLDQALLVYDTATFEQVSCRRLDAIKAVAFSPDNQFLAAVDIRGRISLWSTASDHEVAALTNFRTTKSDEALAFSTGGTHLISSNATTVRIWNLAAAAERRALRGHGGGISCLAFHPAGQTLASGAKDQLVRFWDAATGTLTTTVDCPGPVQALAYSPDGRYLAVGTWSPRHDNLRLFDADTMALAATIAEPLGDVYALVFPQRGGQLYLAGTTSKGLHLWKLEPSASADGKLTIRKEHVEAGERCLFLASSREGRWLAWVHQDRRIRLLDVPGRGESPLHAPLMNQGWHGLAFLPGKPEVLYISHEGCAEVWNVEQDCSSCQLGVPKSFRAPHLALSTDGQWFAGLTDPRVVSVWNLPARREEFSLRPERSAIWSLAWSPARPALAVGLSDGGLAIWDLEAIERQLTTLDSH